MTHVADTDCTPDPETGCCSECGVEHGEPCEVCGGCGFHKSWCGVEFQKEMGVHCHRLCVDAIAYGQADRASKAAKAAVQCYRRAGLI